MSEELQPLLKTEKTDSEKESKKKKGIRMSKEKDECKHRMMQMIEECTTLRERNEKILDESA